MKKYIIILIFITLKSCSTTNNLSLDKIIGKYQWTGFYGVGSSIELKKDNRFEYNWHQGLMWGTTLGTWRKEGIKIVINSDIQPNQPENENFEIINTKLEYENTDILTFRLIDKNNEPIIFASCSLIKDNTIIKETSTDIYGQSEIPRSNADSLIISSLGFKTIKIELSNAITHYELRMKEAEINYYEYFTEKEFTYKKDRLYDYSIRKDKFIKKRYYEKIKVK